MLTPDLPEARGTERDAGRFRGGLLGATHTA